MTDGLHPALDVDDAGQVALGVAGDQLLVAGTSRAALEGAPCGSPIAAVTDELVVPIPGQLVTPRGHQGAAVADRAAASPVLGAVAGTRGAYLLARQAYRDAVVDAVDELERAGARDAFSRVAEAAGVSRQSLRTLVYRARADR